MKTTLKIHSSSDPNVGFKTGRRLIRLHIFHLGLGRECALVAGWPSSSSTWLFAGLSANTPSWPQTTSPWRGCTWASWCQAGSSPSPSASDRTPQPFPIQTKNSNRYLTQVWCLRLLHYWKANINNHSMQRSSSGVHSLLHNCSRSCAGCVMTVCSTMITNPGKHVECWHTRPSGAYCWFTCSQCQHHPRSDCSGAGLFCVFHKIKRYRAIKEHTF